MTNLKKSMGATAGTFVALSAVLGSGMMILPGTSYQDLSGSAWIPWAIAALSVIPLLSAYAWLGRRYPSASGVAYYAEVALGKTAGRAVGIVAAIGLLAAIPATAITGGQYVAEFIDLDAAALVFPVVVLVGATTVAYLGAIVSSRLQLVLIIGLFAFVAGIAVFALSANGFEPLSLDVPVGGDIGGVLTTVYMAFSGWEVISSTFEEHKRTDLIPRIFATSYVIVVTLYALVLLGLFAAVDPTDPRLSSAPLLALAQRSLGDLAYPIMLVMVIACITANVCAASLALSRLVFGLARSGYLPAALSRVRMRDQNPVAAVLVVGMTVTPIAALGAVELFSFEMLFSLVGGLFFVLYGVGVGAFAVLAKGTSPRVVAVIGGTTILGVTVIAGPSMWLSWAVFVLVLLLVAALNPWTSRTMSMSREVDPATVQFAAIEVRRTVQLRVVDPPTVRFRPVAPRTADYPTVRLPQPCATRRR